MLMYKARVGNQVEEESEDLLLDLINNLATLLIDYLSQMRKRSGAIHSETQQQFIELAEKSLDRTGIFYDEKYYSQPNVQQSQPQLQTEAVSVLKANPFAQFDFDEGKQYEMEEEEISKQTDKNSMASLQYLIICDNVPETMGTINGGQASSREIDLVVRKVETKNGKTATMKYWVMDKCLMDAPLTQIYLSSSKRVLWVSQSPCCIATAVVIAVEQLPQYISQQEETYMSIMLLQCKQ